MQALNQIAIGINTYTTAVDKAEQISSSLIEVSKNSVKKTILYLAQKAYRHINIELCKRVSLNLITCMKTRSEMGAQESALLIQRPNKLVESKDDKISHVLKFLRKYPMEPASGKDKKKLEECLTKAYLKRSTVLDLSKIKFHKLPNELITGLFPNLRRLDIRDNNSIEIICLKHPNLSRLEIHKCREVRKVDLELPQLDEMGLIVGQTPTLNLEKTPRLRILEVSNSALREILNLPRTCESLFATNATNLTLIQNLENSSMKEITLGGTQVNLPLAFLQLPTLKQVKVTNNVINNVIWQPHDS